MIEAKNQLFTIKEEYQNIKQEKKIKLLSKNEFYKKNRYIIVNDDDDDNENYSKFNNETFKKIKLEQDFNINFPITYQPIDKLKSNIQKQLLGNGQFKKDTISIVSWNINGFKRILKIGAFTIFFQKYSPDILCLQEIKMSQNQVFQQAFNQSQISYYYFSYYNLIQATIGYSGVAILSKQKPLAVYNLLGNSIHDVEGRFLMLEFDKFFIINTYQPTSGPNHCKLDYRIKEWDRDIKNFILNLKLHPQKKSIIWCGDLNVIQTPNDIHTMLAIKFGYAKNSYCGNSFQQNINLQQLFNQGFVDTFRKFYPNDKDKFTYFTFEQQKNRNVGLRIDYFICDDQTWTKNTIIESTIYSDVNGSDHVPIQLKLDLTKI